MPAWIKLILKVALSALLLSACTANTPTPTPIPTGSAPQATATTAASVTPQASPTPAPPEKRALVICVPEEPSTLYIYGGASRSMWSILEAIYDGPFDTREYGVQPVILQKLPSLADGDAQIAPVAVQSGDAVVDVAGNLVALQTGTRVFPAGCNAEACAVTWDGFTPLQMDQLSVQFKLLAGLQWSDGTPLTAADSALSYQLSADPATPTSKYLTDRTYAYTALDDLTAQWTGIPGYANPRFQTLFWLPLPQHLYQNISAVDLLQNSSATRQPIGWGAYLIQEWVDGDHITLVKNPTYFRAAEGLPHFDSLVYRFNGPTGDAQTAAVQSGECDITDLNDEFVSGYPTLNQKESEGKLKTFTAHGPEWEHLDFGVRPAAYDDGFDMASGDRPDLFGDVRTRQAFALCIDRQGIVNELLYARSQVPTAFMPANHPLMSPDLPAYAYDPAAGAALLDAVGWKDTDANPATPRVAQGVTNVVDGTVLSVRYQISQAGLRAQVAQRVATSLQGCGIATSPESLSAGDLFAPGPDGALFGRSFDLTQFAWESGARPNCGLYTSAQVPASANQWIGVNITGYASPAYDAACEASARVYPGQPEYETSQAAVQAIFANDLPVIPLYDVLKANIARADFCPFTLDVSARSIFWNIEALDYGCP